MANITDFLGSGATLTGGGLLSIQLTSGVTPEEAIKELLDRIKVTGTDKLLSPDFPFMVRPSGDFDFNDSQGIYTRSNALNTISEKQYWEKLELIRFYVFTTPTTPVNDQD